MGNTRSFPVKAERLQQSETESAISDGDRLRKQALASCHPPPSSMLGLGFWVSLGSHERSCVCTLESSPGGHTCDKRTSRDCLILPNRPVDIVKGPSVSKPMALVHSAGAHCTLHLAPCTLCPAPCTMHPARCNRPGAYGHLWAAHLGASLAPRSPQVWPKGSSGGALRGAKEEQKMLLQRIVVCKQVKVAPSYNTKKKSIKRGPRDLCPCLIRLALASGPPWAALKVFDCNLRPLLYSTNGR